jgi:hypothetical protein
MISRNRLGATTFIAEPRPRLIAVVVTALYGVCVLWPFVAGKYRLGTNKWSPRLVMHFPEAAVVSVLAIVAVGLIWGWSRSWRMGLYMNQNGVTVRNYFRTYRFGWPEVTRLVDGSPWYGYWALSVLVTGGGAVTASGTASRFKARPETLTAIRQVAECHGIAARLTGLPAADGRYPKRRRAYLFWIFMILAYLFLAAFFLVTGVHCPTGSCGS